MVQNNEEEIFNAILNNDINAVKDLLKENSQLVNARILGDATLLDNKV